MPNADTGDGIVNSCRCGRSAGAANQRPVPGRRV